MRYKSFHKWDVTPKEAIEIQKKLSRYILMCKTTKPVKLVAGIDASFAQNTSFAAVVILDFPALTVIEKALSSTKTDFPYIPGLLTFREGPAILNCLKKIRNIPDIFIFDGQGIAHPRKMGLATHMGILLQKPSIGCAKTYLYGKFGRVGNLKGQYSILKDKSNKSIGAVLRTRQNTKPVFVSPGHLIDIKKAVKIVLALCPKYRIPEPLRFAHQLSKMYR